MLNNPPLPLSPRSEAPVVLALDLSITRTGWAIHDLDGVRSGAKSFPIQGKENPALRFHRFDKWIEESLIEKKPDIVVYEKNNYKTMNFGHAIYCSASLSNRLDVHCALLGIRTLEIMPNAVKLAFTGSGGADPDKERMKAKAAELWPDYDPEKDVGGDEADSRALTYCYANREKFKLFEFEPKKPPRQPKPLDTHVRAYRARERIVNAGKPKPRTRKPPIAGEKKAK